MAAEGGRQAEIHTVGIYLLQWGRGRMAAEGRPPPCRRAAPRWLQWGRGRMAAEG